MKLKLRIICLTKDNCYCESINLIEKSFDDGPKLPGEQYMNILNTYCPESNCSSDELKIIAGFIMLLNMIGEEDINGDKLVEYAILWLSYKLNQKKKNGTTILNDFHTGHIKGNDCYSEHIDTDNSSGNKIYMGVIDEKIESMDIDIKDISNFYDAFKSLCNMYIEIGTEKNTKCKTCLENAGEFLSNDYKNFKQEYSAKCSSISPLVACPRSSITKNMLITIAIIFVAASILLGVSYKYSLFGFRKRSQKQHLREKLKNSDYSMNSNND
ncbi:putative bir1 protein [Plasmodium yoelii yoelii]|uniref:Bir1 protein n=1 Tax=Plasmodium yoelii yoelii TaxID=73239 RepID=Q7R7R5_PLAYO|nr:putative bir1 protein [Plasmodium yoelii yoelii]